MAGGTVHARGAGLRAHLLELELVGARVALEAWVGAGARAVTPYVAPTLTVTQRHPRAAREGATCPCRVLAQWGRIERRWVREAYTRAARHPRSEPSQPSMGGPNAFSFASRSTPATEPIVRLSAQGSLSQARSAREQRGHGETRREGGHTQACTRAHATHTPKTRPNAAATNTPRAAPRTRPRRRGAGGNPAPRRPCSRHVRSGKA